MISGYQWVKVYSHNAVGGFFPNLEAAKEYNTHDSDADLYSILYKVGEYGKDGLFHIRFCWEELTDYPFPCNEWTQTSNFVEEEEITDFEEVDITFKESGTGGVFGGLGLSPASFANNLIDDLPYSGNWWYSVGTLSAFGSGFPGPHPIGVKKSALYLLTSTIIIMKFKNYFVLHSVGLPGPIGSGAEL